MKVRKVLLFTINAALSIYLGRKIAIGSGLSDPSGDEFALAVMILTALTLWAVYTVIIWKIKQHLAVRAKHTGETAPKGYVDVVVHLIPDSQRTFTEAEARRFMENYERLRSTIGNGR